MPLKTFELVLAVVLAMGAVAANAPQASAYYVCNYQYGYSVVQQYPYYSNTNGYNCVPYSQYYYSYPYSYSGTSYSDLQSQYDTLKTQSTQLQSDNAALKQQVGTLQGQVDSTNKQFNDARNQFSQQLSDLQAQNRAVQANMEAMRQQDAAVIDSIRAQNTMLLVGAAALGLALIGAIFLSRRGVVEVREGRRHYHRAGR